MDDINNKDEIVTENNLNNLNDELNNLNNLNEEDGELDLNEQDYEDAINPKIKNPLKNDEIH
ncbi:3268_t:CDS:2, partial [Rhizophagus irregularis]